MRKWLAARSAKRTRRQERWETLDAERTARAEEDVVYALLRVGAYRRAVRLAAARDRLLRDLGELA